MVANADAGKSSIVRPQRAWLRISDAVRRSMAFMGFSWCRVCGKNDIDMGCCDVTDGVYQWPEGLAHYVVEHRVALPPAFLEKIDGPLLADDRSSSLLALLESGAARVDGAAWCTWAGVSLPSRHDGPRGWFVTGPVGGRGPYDDDELRARIRAGEVHRHHRMWKLGIGPERKVRDVPGFGELCQPPPPL